MPPRVLWLALLALELAQRCGGVPAELKQQAGRSGDPAAGPTQKFRPAASVPLADAAAKGDIAVLKELLKSGDHPIDQSAGFGMTALHLASGRDRADAVALLLAHGASPTAIDARGWTPLHLAASRGASEAALELLQSGANVMAKENDGNRASALAEQEGFVALARTLGRAEAAVMRRSEEETRSSISRAASSQLPAATLKAAATSASSPGSPGSPRGGQSGIATGSRSSGGRSQTAEAVGAAERDLLHRHVPRSDGQGAEAEADAGAQSASPPASSAPTDVLLPLLSRSVTAHHKVIYHDGAEGSGEMGVGVEPTDHKQKLLGRSPSEIAKTRDKVAGWFSSPDAAQTHAKQFAAAKAEAAANREKTARDDSLEDSAHENIDTAERAANETETAEDGRVSEASQQRASEGNGQESTSGPFERGGPKDVPDGMGGADDGARTQPKKKVKTMQELSAVNAKSLHTLPRLSNDTVVKKQHFHAEEKPQHAPARHAELVAAALAAQEEAVDQGLPPTRGMQHPAIRKFLEKQKQADASPSYGYGDPRVGDTQDKLEPVRTIVSHSECVHALEEIQHCTWTLIMSFAP
eukprot:COSAG02_NODE_1615_length_11668_cov_6.226294_8_plen_584_part_00